MRRSLSPWLLAGALCAVLPAQSAPAGPPTQPPGAAPVVPRATADRPTPAPAPAASARCEHPPCTLSPSLPLRRDDAAQDSTGGSGWGAWLVLAGVALAGAWLVRRRGGSLWPAGRVSGVGTRSILARVASQSLAPQATVHVLRWRDEEWLLGCTPQSVTVLARCPVAGVDGATVGSPSRSGPPGWPEAPR